MTTIEDSSDEAVQEEEQAVDAQEEQAVDAQDSTVKEEAVPSKRPQRRRRHHRDVDRGLHRLLREAARRRRREFERDACGRDYAHTRTWRAIYRTMLDPIGWLGLLGLALFLWLIGDWRIVIAGSLSVVWIHYLF